MPSDARSLCRCTAAPQALSSAPTPGRLLEAFRPLHGLAIRTAAVAQLTCRTSQSSTVLQYRTQLVSCALCSTCCSVCAVLTIVSVCCNGCRVDLHAQEEKAPWERLYEQCIALCSAFGFVCVRLTMAVQVYGGSMSFVVGAYVWSCSPQYRSFYSAGDTAVSGLSMVFDNNRISGSQAVTSTEGALFVPNPAFQMHAHTHA